MRINGCCYGVLLIVSLGSIPRIVAAQDQTGMQQILQRLDRLEQENRTLSAEVSALRSELSAARETNPGATQPAGTGEPAAAVPLEERVAVEEQRTADQAQAKVEAAHRLPITLTGMVLFNAFLNGKASGGQEDPAVAASLDSHSGSGASVSQSLLGFNFQGPQIVGGGQVSGQLHLDLWGGTSNSLNHLIRVRVATLSVDWKNQSIVVGQDKPIVSPRDPTSLAQVAVSPLAAAGNLWLWQPQVRFEQRFALGDAAGIRARVGLYQTAESTADATTEYASTLSSARPGIEGRFEFWRKFGEHARIEIAPGFHTSDTHVAGGSVPSRLFTVDWLIEPMRKVQFTGLFFTGENASVIGGLRGGFTVFPSNLIQAVGATGGWAQLSYLATSRLTFNIYGGQEGHRTVNLVAGEITRNFEYAGNAIYKFGSNVLVGLEASQVRTNYLQQSNRLVNHYDLALGYLF
jgi:hypothetical protein